MKYNGWKTINYKCSVQSFILRFRKNKRETESSTEPNLQCRQQIQLSPKGFTRTGQYSKPSSQTKTPNHVLTTKLSCLRIKISCYIKSSLRAVASSNVSKNWTWRLTHGTLLGWNYWHTMIASQETEEWDVEGDLSVADFNNVGLVRLYCNQ